MSRRRLDLAVPAMRDIIYASQLCDPTGLRANLSTEHEAICITANLSLDEAAYRIIDTSQLKLISECACVRIRPNCARTDQFAPRRARFGYGSSFHSCLYLSVPANPRPVYYSVVIGCPAAMLCRV